MQELCDYLTNCCGDRDQAQALIPLGGEYSFLPEPEKLVPILPGGSIVVQYQKLR